MADDATIEDKVERINALLDSQEARIAEIFRTAVQALKDEIDLDALAELLRVGRIGEAMDQLQIVAEQLGSASNLAFVTSGQSTADFLRNAGVGRVLFDQVNVAAVAAMQRNRLEMIREFTDEQRRAVSAAVIAGNESGYNPIAQARNFRDAIGLTESQWSAVANYRRALETVNTSPDSAAIAISRELRDKRGDAAVQSAVRNNRPIAPEKVDWLIKRYAEKYVGYRSRVIARTEALRAVHQGQEESYRQAIEAGTLDPERIQRTWRTHMDGRERESHALINRQTRGWGESWQTIYGELQYPGDPDGVAADTIQCRCALLYRLKAP